MGLVSLKELMSKADRGGYALGAFNVNNMEIVKAVIETAEEESSPVIVQVTPGAIKYAGWRYIIPLLKAALEDTAVPAALHLDHGTDFNVVVRCIVSGFTSVMFDGSKLPLRDNISATAHVVEVAEAAGVSVEGELGRIEGSEDSVSIKEQDAFLTDPEEALFFLQETGVDALAVAVGTAHGPYKGEPVIDFPRLQKIRELCNVPLVMHGASGVPEESITRSIELGIRKINIDTELRQAFIKAVSKYMEDNPHNIDPRKMLQPAVEEMKKVIRQKVRLFGSASRA